MRRLLLVCAVLFSCAVFSQPKPHSDLKTGSISGHVIDATSSEPLAYVNVIIKDKDDKVITGGITDANGNFSIGKIPEGNVIVDITYIGYKTLTQNVTIGQGNYKINLGDIKLEENTESLDEITIVAEVSTIQQKVDRKVITIGKDLTTSGPTASDIMNNLPSVSVDQQTGDISLRGNQNVQVMVDGKLTNISAAQLLRQIPSTSIKQIELITNPSAKYNPDGLSGIINIILHKNINIGFNGNFNVGIAYEREAKFNSSIDANYRNGKLNFFGSYGNNISRNDNFGNVQRPTEGISQIFNFEDQPETHLIKFGVDYYINDKNTFSVFTNQNIFDGVTVGNTDILFPETPSLNNFQFFDNENENNSQQYNANYKLDFEKEGHNIELEVDHNIFDSEVFGDNTFTGNIDRPNFFEDTQTDRNRTTINLDYVNPLSETAKIEAGLQARLFESDINYLSDARILEFDDMNNEVPVPTRINFDYTRDIYSAYVSYNKEFEKFSVQLGLRAETVQVDAIDTTTNLETNTTTVTPFENDYTELYPSAFVTYKPSEKNSWQVSYSRRIDRPGIQQVNPLPEFNTALISAFGNQELLPQFTNSVELNYTRQLKKGSITAGVFGRVINDEINRVIRFDRDDPTLQRLILSFENFDETYAYGIEVSSNYRPTKWWSINGSFDLFSQTQNSISEVLEGNTIETRNIEVDNVAWNLRMFNNFKVSKALSFSAFVLYRGQNRNVQFDVNPMSMVNLGMRYNFLEDDRATFSLNFNDIFDTMFFDFESDRPFTQNGDFNWESRTIFAGLSYRFGGGKYRAKSRKRRDNDEKSGSGGFI